MGQERKIELIYGINTFSLVILAGTGHKTPLPFMIISQNALEFSDRSRRHAGRGEGRREE